MPGVIPRCVVWYITHVTYLRGTPYNLLHRNYAGYVIVTEFPFTEYMNIVNPVLHKTHTRGT
jgi:hypothetical protein